MNVKDLSEKEFYELAKSQSKIFPDLLMFREEDEIIKDFYDYYKRKFPV